MKQGDEASVKQLITHEADDRIRELASQGVSYRKISEILGLNESWVYRRMLLLGVGERRLSKEEKKQQQSFTGLTSHAKTAKIVHGAFIWPAELNSLPKGEKAIQFIERYCHHSAAEWAGKPFKLREWQKQILRDILDTVKPDGLRKYKKVFLTFGRKNGKTELLSALALFLLLDDDELGKQVYVAAASREQASLLFDAAVWSVRLNEDLGKALTIIASQKRLFYEAGNSYMRAISAESATAYGFNSYCVLADEVHAWPNRDLWDVLETSFGVRKQPLMLAITTAGFDKNSLCYELYQHAKGVADGTRKDETFYSAIYETPQEDDWKDEQNWYKANPALGDFRNIEEMRELFQKAKEIPAFENSFRRLYLNQWTEQETRYIPMERWIECNDPIGDLPKSDCYGGLDLSMTTDLTAFVLCFPDGKGLYSFKPFFWVPEESMRQRVRRDKVPYDVWAREGLIETTPGDVVDYHYVIERIKLLKKEFKIKEIAFDRWGAAKIDQDLTDAGFTLVPFGQGFASMNGPTKELLKLVLERKIRHGNNPVLEWQARNMVVRTDPAGNLKPDKEKSSERIDGMVALLMSLDRAMRHAGSVYKNRGLTII